MRKHAFFDLDGTLTDPFEGIRACISYALQKLGEPVPDDVALRSWIGPPLYASFERHVGTDRAALALVYYRERFGDTGWRENRVYDGIPSELHRLAEGGWQLSVATSKPTIFAERIITHFGLADCFQRIFGSELDGTRTGKTELLHFAIQNSAPADLSVMIGDREHDIVGALKNGMVPVGVAYGYGSIDELERAGAAAVVERPCDISNKLSACKLSQ